ncbi:MAG: hypothetical protein KDK25_00865 [Leptospiraceae bacterium]|nr:hypothetical protein [Leptospiraceae bacterium]
MKDRIRLLPHRSSTVGGPILLVAGLAFLSLGLFEQYRNQSLSAELLISLGFLAAGLGSTILIYMRRVALRTFFERINESGKWRFRIRIVEPGGETIIPSGAIQAREIRISPRTGPVFFVRMPGGIFLELHRFSSRRRASHRFLEIERLQKECLRESRAGSLSPVPGRGMAGAVRLIPDQHLAYWRDTVGLETALPLAVFLAGLSFLLLHGMNLQLSWEIRLLLFAAFLFLGLLSGAFNSSVRYLQRTGNEIRLGRLLFRYSLKARGSNVETPGILHRFRSYEDTGMWELWREEAQPTPELRLSSERKPRPSGRIRLHSSLAGSLAIHQCVFRR